MIAFEQQYHVPPIPNFGRNRTLFGLRTNANLIVRYAPYQNRIEAYWSTPAKDHRQLR